MGWVHSQWKKISVKTRKEEPIHAESTQAGERPDVSTVL